jgi:glycosyltransferase involved in cell wall biosynthesis
MNVVMISTDRNLFDSESNVSARFKKYGTLFSELHVVVLNVGNVEPYSLLENVHVHPINANSKLGYIFMSLKKFSFENVDVVSSQDAFLTGVIGSRLAKKLQTTFHVQIHTDLFSQAYSTFSFKNKIEVVVSKFILKKADAIRVVSRRIKQSLLKNLPKISEDIITVLPIQVSKKEVTETLTFPYTYIVTTIARLEKEKQVEKTITAFALATRGRTDVGLLIIGSGSLKKKLQTLVEQFGIVSQVQFLGSVENVSNVLSVSDVYIQTSAYEGYGMALAEAALHTLPIVTTDVGIVGETLVDGGSCLVSLGDTKDVAAKLAHVLDNDIEGKSLGNRAYENVLEMVGGEEVYLREYKSSLSKS